MKSGFWIYWAITIPLTTIVLVAYLTYLLQIQRRDRLEDHKIVRHQNEESKGRSTHAVHSADAGLSVVYAERIRSDTRGRQGADAGFLT